ncbi:carnitine O-acetyltransferase [Ixodes scapularis]
MQIIASRQPSTSPTRFLSLVEISRSTHICPLGVIIDQHFDFHRYVKNVVSGERRLLGYVIRSTRRASRDVPRLLFTALVLPILELCCSAADGFGVQRMIYGLIFISLENGIPIHPFLKNQAFWRPALVASQVNLQCDGTSLEDPGFPDTYMVMYNIRPESVTFGLSCNKSSPEKNITKFKDALEQALTDLRAADGFGVQRMIYGLIFISLENGIPIHPFLKNQAFWRPALVASQVNLQCDGTSLEDPGFPDTYMVMYNIRPESVTFGLSCNKSSPEKNITKFKDALEQALTDLRVCVDRS